MQKYVSWIILLYVSRNALQYMEYRSCVPILPSMAEVKLKISKNILIAYFELLMQLSNYADINFACLCFVTGNIIGPSSICCSHLQSKE